MAADPADPAGAASPGRAEQYARWRELHKLRAAGEHAAPAGRQSD